jgi:hypothetical protein
MFCLGRGGSPLEHVQAGHAPMGSGGQIGIVATPPIAMPVSFPGSGVLSVR